MDILEHHGVASTLLSGTVIDQAGCSHILTGMPHGLVDGELVWGLPSQAPAQQDLAEFRANTRIQTSQLPAASWGRLESQPALHEEARRSYHLGVQFSSWGCIANRGDMHAGREPVEADHRLT